MLQIRTFTVGPFAEHPYLLICSETNHAILVDPGDSADELWQAITDAGVELKAIVLTHAHLDHSAQLQQSGNTRTRRSTCTRPMTNYWRWSFYKASYSA